MQANGGGVGPSSAMTQAGLMLNASIAGARSMCSDFIHRLESNRCCIFIDLTVTGTVNANGQLTSVYSLSNLTDVSGVQTATNYQTSMSKGNGSSQASASNVGILKRRRRRGTIEERNAMWNEFRTTFVN